MDVTDTVLQKTLLVTVVDGWFQPHYRQKVLSPIESQFPNWALPGEIQDILVRTQAISNIIGRIPGSQFSFSKLVNELNGENPNLLSLLKRIILVYRRDRAAYIEGFTGKTFHLELAATLEAEIKALDVLTTLDRFLQIEELRLPRLKDFLPVQYIESAGLGQVALQSRQYDEKFHILQAPQLFLPDLAYFRAKCEDRETPLAIAFVDIDGFKNLNTIHTHTKVDRNLLPRFMQTLEAHVFHHGYAYRQGGDEYLILVPSFSRPLAIAFFEELRSKVADLSYPDIAEKTTVSIGLCIVDPDCPLTDRELLDRANHAAQFAKENGKNRIAAYAGPRFVAQELEIVSQAP